MAVFDNLNYSYSSGVQVSDKGQFYARKLLENAKPEMVHARDAQKKTLPKHNGKRVQFRRATPLSAITKPLSEGVTPVGQTVSMTAFTVMPKPYAGHIEVTDEFNLYKIDDMDSLNAELLADQAALSLDTILRDALHTGLNVQYVGSNTARSTIAATDKLTYAEIKKTVRTLKRNNVKPFDDGYYHAIVHPDVVYDLTSDTMWTDVAKYQDKSKPEKYELGTIYKVKFYESTNAKVFQDATYIYGTTSAITASADYDATNKKITTTATITEDDARALTGLLVYAQYSTSNNYPVCIERVVVTATGADIYLRYAPASEITDNWTTVKTFKLVPTGGGASNAKVYSTLIFGKDAFGTVELEDGGGNVQIIINPPGSAGAADPAAQRGTIAWKVRGFCGAILNDNNMVRVESGATA